MKSPEKQNEVWILASLAAPIAHIASGLTWSSVLAASLLASGFRWILTRWKERNIVRQLYAALCILLLGVSMQWMRQCWRNQEDIEWILGILLLLGAVLAYKGKECVINASMVLWWMTAFLLGSVLISAMKEIKIRNITLIYSENNLTGLIKLTAIMTIPAVVEVKNAVPNRIMPLTAMAMIFSVCTGGVLTYPYAEKNPAPFYELSRSIRLYGMMDRMESLAWLGMMLGTFLYITLLLTGAMQMKIAENKKAGVIGAALLWTILYNRYI